MPLTVFPFTPILSSLFTCAIKLLQSQFSQVFSGTLVALYLSGKTWNRRTFR
jgi:hypothetical protein